MAIEHVAIPDAERHPPKGASTAVAGTQPISDGAGDVTWFVPEPKGAGSAANGEILISDGLGSTSWGNSVVQAREVLSSHSLLIQNPSGVDTPLQVEFGAAQITPEIDLSSTGLVTIKQAGTYRFAMEARIGRTGGAGVATVFGRILVDGVQVYHSIAADLDDGNFQIPWSLSIIETLPVGALVSFEVLRDSGGVNNGGLYPKAPTAAAWNPAPSASMVISKLETGGL
ncbi:MAG: hypothetical protein Unbinned6805contig1000_45 [Prokaryotic dsDNA virus sp.]|nr:MAG: hypothetical protein Unbinned6805contig1000_45 [Prokaryotic dsDNA virus sp.]|tara:strand:+ start:1624 stop:2307 length:684 start_codon:yes stop_codon:yes gene_type:complete